MTRAVAGASSLPRYSPVRASRVKYTESAAEGTGITAVNRRSERTYQREREIRWWSAGQRETERECRDPRRKAPTRPALRANDAILPPMLSTAEPRTRAAMHFCHPSGWLLSSSLSRCRENMAYYLRSVAYTHTHSLIHATRNHARTKNRFTVSRLGSWLSPRRRASLSLLFSSSSVFAPFRPSSLLGAGLGISPSRRLGTFRFFPRGGTPRSTSRRRVASSARLLIKVPAARCRYVSRASAIDFRCATRRVILIRSCREWEMGSEARIYRSERLLNVLRINIGRRDQLNAFPMLLSVD